MDDLVIVKMRGGVNIKADMMEYWRKEILKQKETGVIVLPWFLTAVVVPKDTEIRLEDLIVEFKESEENQCYEQE